MASPAQQQAIIKRKPSMRHHLLCEVCPVVEAVEEKVGQHSTVLAAESAALASVLSALSYLETPFEESKETVLIWEAKRSTAREDIEIALAHRATFSQQYANRIRHGSAPISISS